MILLDVKDMACGGCVKSIKEAVAALDGACVVEADLTSGRVEVQTRLEAEAIRAAIEEAGFPADIVRAS